MPRILTNSPEHRHTGNKLENQNSLLVILHQYVSFNNEGRQSRHPPSLRQQANVGSGFSMRGGKREGAGRPPIDPQLVKVPVGYKLPRWLVEWMRARPESQAMLIEESLKKRHKLKPPEGA